VTDLAAAAAAAAELLDDLEHDVEAEAEEVTVGVVLIVVELLAGDPDPTHEGGATRIAYRCTDTRAWVQRGLLRAAIAASLEGDRL